MNPENNSENNLGNDAFHQLFTQFFIDEMKFENVSDDVMFDDIIDNSIFLQTIFRQLTAIDPQFQNEIFIFRLNPEDMENIRSEPFPVQPSEYIPPQTNEETNEENDGDDNGNEGVICPISREPFKENDICYKLKCGHIFGQGIVEWWNSGNRTCPVCRRKIE